MKKLSLNALLLVLTLQLFCMNMPVHAEESQIPSDLENHWAKSYILPFINNDILELREDGTFAPDEPMNRADFVSMLVKSMDLGTSNRFYFDDLTNHEDRKYIGAALEHGLILMTDTSEMLDGNFEPNKAISREEVAIIITRALGKEFDALGIASTSFKDNDVINQGYRGYVSIAADSGVITGNSKGLFIPDGQITRADACVVASRLMAIRSNETIDKASSEDIYQNFYNASVKIYATDSDGNISQGSGFVINKAGKIVTNYHVVDGADRVEVHFNNGTTKKVLNINNYDEAYDIAVLNIEAGEYDYAPIGSSRNLKMGSKIYTLGYPKGSNFTISDGLISSTYTQSNVNYIQISAPVSHGSSGGALVNEAGEVIGITTLSHDEAQNLNYAVPISDVCSIIGTAKETSLETALSNDPFDGFVYEFSAVLQDKNHDSNLLNPIYMESNKMKYISIAYDLLHESQMRNNQVLIEIYLTDPFGNLVDYYAYYEKLNTSYNSIYHHTLNGSYLTTKGEGEFYVMLFIDGEFHDESKIIIDQDVAYSTFEPNATRLKIFDYEIYDHDNENATMTYTKRYKKDSISGIGLDFDVAFNKENSTDENQYLLYEILIEKNGTTFDNYYTASYLAPGEKGFGFYEYYSPEDGTFDVGEYTVKLYYNDEYLTSDSFTVVDGTELNINSQSLDITKSYDADSDDSSDNIYTDRKQYIVYNVKHNSLKHQTDVKMNFVYRTSEGLSTEGDYDSTEDWYYVVADGNTTSELWQTIDKMPSEILEAYNNGSTVFLDIYLNDKLIDTIEIVK